jgi:glycosyltransferase involved in cell wall biosynthesis
MPLMLPELAHVSPAPEQRRVVQKLKLLIFSPYFRPHIGGVETYVSDLNKALARDGEVERVTVFAPRVPADALAREQEPGGNIVLRYPAFDLIPNFPVPKLWNPEFWRLLRDAKPADNQVLVSHTRFFLSSVLALACARLVRRPLLHVEHGSDYVQLSHGPLKAAARAYDRLIGRLLLRRADALVAVSHGAATFVLQLAGRDAVVIHRGVWPAQLQTPPDEHVLERAAGRCVVAYAGRLIDGKGVSDLLQAFAAAHDEQALLCLVGDGPRRQELESLARALGILERVLFLGYVSEQRVAAVICASDIVVNPSYTEGLPAAVLEGALMGKPVVATDVGGTSEIVSDGEGGFLIPARDVEAMATRLQQLLDDAGLRERMGRAARVEAAGRFDWETTARSYVEVLRGLATAAAGRRARAVQLAGAANTSSKTDS